MKVLVTWDKNEDGEVRWRVFDGAATFSVQVKDTVGHRYQVTASAPSHATMVENEAQGGVRKFKLKSSKLSFRPLIVSFTARAISEDDDDRELPEEAQQSVTVVDGRLQWLALVLSVPLLVSAFVASWVVVNTPAGTPWIELGKVGLPAFLWGAFFSELRGLFRSPRVLPLLGVFHVPAYALAAGIVVVPLLLLPKHVLTAVENATAASLKGPTAETSVLGSKKTILAVGRHEAVEAAVREANGPFDEWYDLADGGTAETPALVNLLDFDRVTVRCGPDRWPVADALTFDGGMIHFTVSPDCKRDASGLEVDADRLTAVVDRAAPATGPRSKPTGSIALLMPPHGAALAQSSWFHDRLADDIRVEFPVVRDTRTALASADVVVASAANADFPKVVIRYGSGSDAPVVTPLRSRMGQADIEIRSPGTEDALGKLTCQFPPGTVRLELWQLPATGLARLFVNHDTAWSSTWVTQSQTAAWICRPREEPPRPPPHADARFSSTIAPRERWSLTVPRAADASAWSVGDDSGVTTLLCDDDASALVPATDLVTLRPAVVDGQHGPGRLEVKLVYAEGTWTSISQVVGPGAWTCSPGLDAPGLHGVKTLASTGSGSPCDIEPVSNRITVHGPPPRVCYVPFATPSIRTMNHDGCGPAPPNYVAVRADALKDCDVVNTCPRRPEP